MSEQQQMVLDQEVEIKKVTRQLDVPLTHIEKAQLSDDAGELEGQIEETTEELKNAKVALKKTLQKMKTGIKTDNVTCEMKLFYKNRLVQIWHIDKLVEERAMTDAEFQQEFREFSPEPETDENEETELTPEEAKQDLEDVIREEKSATKVVHT